MRVLVACEESQAVTLAFRDRGHEAYSCDLQPCSGGHPEWHHQGNVFDLLSEQWDLMIAHPPCTYLANSGARWMYDDDGDINMHRMALMQEGAAFFTALNSQFHIPRVCIENPIPHYHAGLPQYTQKIQPWQFGDNYSKATCLWLRGLPPLVPSVLKEPENVIHACHMEPPGPERAKNRSKTYPGIAAAMAEQWGGAWEPSLELAS